MPKHAHALHVTQNTYAHPCTYIYAHQYIHGPTNTPKHTNFLDSLQTEVARRLAKLAGAPFIKVEATKYTEVGFHGKDVDTMIKVSVNSRSESKS